jgi:signal transduction histidine kinase
VPEVGAETANETTLRESTSRTLGEFAPAFDDLNFHDVYVSKAGVLSAHALGGLSGFGLLAVPLKLAFLRLEAVRPELVPGVDGRVHAEEATREATESANQGARVAEESNRLIGVVNSLLDLSKIEAGMMAYEFEMVHIDPLVRRAISEITPLVEAKQIELQSAIEDKLPAARLDPERILQVLRNLIGNAVKFTPNGGQVRVSARPVNGKLEVSVKDSGPGIPAENLTAIFEKFSQGKPRDFLTRQGTGLGLAIAKSIINSHGGEIWAESRLGEGSTFVFVLPC